MDLTHAVEERKRDHGGELVHLGAELVHEVEPGQRGAAGGDEVVHEDHSVARLDAAEPHDRLVGAVLGDVLPAGDEDARELAGLADHHERDLERERDRGTEEEPSRVETRDVRGAVGSLRPVSLHEEVDDELEHFRIFRDSRDVVEGRDVVRGVLRAVPRE